MGIWHFFLMNVCGGFLFTYFIRISWSQIKCSEICIKLCLMESERYISQCILVFKYFEEFIGKHRHPSLFLIKLREACNFIKKETLAHVFFCTANFTKLFKNTSFTEHLRVTASDIRMQVVVIYNLNLALKFLIINLTFSLLWVFTLAHA